MRRAALVVIVAGAMAACTSSKRQPPVALRSALADSADQVMYNTRFNITDEGLKRVELQADTALFFDDNTRVELAPVNATFYTAAGAKDAVLKSRSGTYNTRRSTMTARGNVVVNSVDGRTLTSPELSFDQARNEIASDSAFVFTEPGRRLEGIGFRSDPNLRNVRVLRTLAGQTGSIIIPNQ